MNILINKREGGEEKREREREGRERKREARRRERRKDIPRVIFMYTLFPIPYSPFPGIHSLHTSLDRVRSQALYGETISTSFPLVHQMWLLNVFHNIEFYHSFDSVFPLHTHYIIASLCGTRNCSSN